MPSVEHQMTEDVQHVDDLRRASWTAQLLVDREFRTEQIQQLDRDLAGSPPLAHDDIIKTLRKNAESALRDIDDALARLVTGRFGRCVTCQRVVEPALLDVLPMAAQCMSCRYDADED